MALRLALLSGHYRTDRSWHTGILDEALTRLDRWREAVAQPAGAPTHETLNLLRARMADDLDTASALSAVDAWATETLTQHPRDGHAPALVSAAVDALLGIAL